MRIRDAIKVLSNLNGSRILKLNKVFTVPLFGGNSVCLRAAA